MTVKQLKEVYFTEDGIVDGPQVQQCMGIGGSHWTNHPIELYALVSDGEITKDTTPYHAHFYMTKAKARANWHRLTPSAKARILQCTTVSFTMPDAWETWHDAYLSVIYTEENEAINWNSTSCCGYSCNELVKHWLSGTCPETLGKLVVTKRSYVPHYRWALANA
tara:strand:- start:1715 stop:2209 length:495 start_codon:yes stop_codon:yes gene_type:complete